MSFRVPQKSHRAASGFSLVELLTVIAVLAVMTSIALVSMGQINQNSVDTRDRRNAQELAAICAVAQAAGVNFVASGNLEKTIANIVAGGTPTDGAFAGKFFGLKGLQPADQTSAAKFLELNGGELSYRPY